ncbi:MAG: hypothetical protein J6K97_03710 [Clostridia bacterium]|nr:hypothetical protein [Clostridia bacterium]
MKINEFEYNGIENSVTINGKTNKLETLPPESLAIVKKCADVKLSRIHSEKNKALKTIQQRVFVSVVGVTAAMVARQYDSGSFANILYSSASIVTSLFAIIKDAVATIKYKRTVKKIKNHRELDFALAVEFSQRKKEGDDLTKANEILNEDDGRYAE